MPFTDALSTFLRHNHPEVTLSAEQWSSIVGYVSIWLWLVPSFSQLQENYTLKSGEGLSIVFIIIWLAGDFLNFIGAFLEGLLPTMIILAGYYCLCDVALIWQYYYYRKYHDYFHPPAPTANATEATPLLNNNNASDNDQEKMRAPTLAEEAMRCVVGLGVTTLAGVLSWYVSLATGWGGPRSIVINTQEIGEWRWDAQAAGYGSAILYLTSRIPQIIKNRQTKCEGLSLALFVFAVLGNVTYAASILIKSRERDYLIENLSWLIGAIGCVFLDFVVLGQFISYRKERSELILQRDSVIAGDAIHSA